MSNKWKWCLGLGLGAVLLGAWFWQQERPVTAAVLRGAQGDEFPSGGAAVTEVGHVVNPNAVATKPALPATAPTAMASGGLASPSELQFAQCGRDYTASVTARIATLENSREPRDRLGAALLRQSLAGESDAGIKALSVFADIAASAPNDALAAWLSATRCSRDEDCDQDAAIEHWLRVEPDNAAAWLMALDAAMRRGDLRLAETLLRKAAAAPRIDVHYGDTAQLAAQSIGTPPTTPACAQAAESIGKAMGLDGPGTPGDMAIVAANAMPQMPPLVGFLKLCSPRQAIPAARLAACRSVFGLMARSDLLVFHWVGLRGLSVHAEPADRGQWLRRLRDAQWMQQQAPLLFKPEHMQLVWEQGEVAVMIALLQEAGRWPAPDDWQPPSGP
ncbi:tetratricopeptide repeat protein [Lysobacter tyrosinilyticus]